MKEFFSKMKSGGFVIDDMYKILSLTIHYLVLIPGIFFWGTMYLEEDLGLPHFTFNEFVESGVFGDLVFVAFLLACSVYLFRKMTSVDYCSKFVKFTTDNGIVWKEASRIDKDVEMSQAVYRDEAIDFKSTDKFIIIGVMGRGKTIQLERCALKLHNESKPFVFITSKGGYSWHAGAEFKAKLPKSSLDFYNKFIMASLPHALIIELEPKDEKNQIKMSIEKISNALKDGAFLFVDEGVPLLAIEELKVLVLSTLEDEGKGAAISWQCLSERIGDEHGLFDKVNFVVELNQTPKVAFKTNFNSTYTFK